VVDVAVQQVLDRVGRAVDGQDAGVEPVRPADPLARASGGLLQARQQLARLRGERYTPDADLVERLREAEQERGDNDS
jgi:hypothetical protein